MNLHDWIDSINSTVANIIAIVAIIWVGRKPLKHKK